MMILRPHVAMQGLAIAVMVVLSGCSQATGDGPDSDDSSQPDHDDASGSIAGTVLSQDGFPISRARVIVLSVTGSVETDVNGTFQIDGIQPGEHDVRIEREGFDAVHETVGVQSGHVVELEVVLVPSDNLNPLFRMDHDHDLWQGRDRYVFFDDVLEWHDDDDFPYHEHECAWQPEFWCDKVAVVPEAGKVIPPGTATLEVTADFTAPTEPGNLEIVILAPPLAAPDDHRIAHTLYNVEPGETYTVEIDPERADSGHTRFSDWVMYLEWGGPGPSGSTWNSMRDDIALEVVAIKGAEIPGDPPHPRFWADSSDIEIPTFGFLAQGWAGSTHQHPDGGCGGNCMKFGGIVPPGTTRLDITFAYTLQDPSPTAPAVYDSMSYDYVLGLKDPSKRSPGATWDDYVWPEVVNVESHPDGYGRVLAYSVPLDDMATDTYYDKISKWMYAIAVEGQGPDNDLPMCQEEVCGKYQFTMDVTAINELRNEQLERGVA